MTECWNVLVTLSYGDDDGPLVQVELPLYDDTESDDFDVRVARAEAAGLDALRPFLNNRTHFIATVYVPRNIDHIPRIEAADAASGGEAGRG